LTFSFLRSLCDFSYW